MKKFLTYGLISIVFFACNVKKDVVRVVVIDANTQNKYYYHKISDADNGTNRIPDSAKIAREGTNIDIRVTGFNPLTQTVSVNPVQTNYFYSTQSTLLTSFFPATPAVPASAEKSTDKAIISPPTIEALRFTGIKKLNQKTYCLINDPLYLSVKEYLAFKKKVDSTYKNNFNCFYREIIYFNAQYNELKLSKSLTKACICAYLNAFSGAIRANLNVENIFELNNCALPTALCKNGKDSCDANLITSTELLNANQMYKKYFADAVDSLIRLQTKQTALLKDKKYTSLTDFITKNFNGCETPNKNKTIEQKRDSIARVLILAELADKKFITDLNKDISVYQTFNKTYSDQYDKAITDIIAEYVNLSYLTYDYVQKDLPVENTDEFKANVVLANSTKPESKTITIDLLVNRALKIDFSAGIFYSSLSNDTYEIKKKPGADTLSTINVIKSSNFILGPMAYINFHSQYRGSVNWGGYLGSGLAFNQSTKLVIAGGGSILYGKYQRAILHIGLAAAQVDRISSAYNTGTYFLTSSSYTPTTASRWDIKAMVGISWNLSRTQ